jgi:hypothetical protein
MKGCTIVLRWTTANASAVKAIIVISRGGETLYPEGSLDLNKGMCARMLIEIRRICGRTIGHEKKTKNGQM